MSESISSYFDVKSMIFNEKEHDKIINLLLKDRTTRSNIIWATDGYKERGKGFYPHEEIQKEHLDNGVIIPRAQKVRAEQKERTKDKAEVMTPSFIIKQMVEAVDDELQELPLIQYIRQDWLEITAGEAPYIVNRIDTVSGEHIAIKDRVGFLDKKLQRISKEIDDHDEWLWLAYRAYKASYGYEFQGDSLYLARLNLLHSFVDYYRDKFKEQPSNQYVIEVARIISYNLFQMDGLKYIIPLSDEVGEVFPSDVLTEAGLIEKKVKEPVKVISKNWSKNQLFTFKEITEKEGGKNIMKFDVVIGNPPYQDGNKQIYVDFYLSGLDVSNNVCLIFPTGWQEPKNANNLRRLNNEKVKRDQQIVYINNIQNAFTGVPGAEWTNIILWKRNYDNQLGGKQLVYSDSSEPKHIKLPINKEDIQKPAYIVELNEIVSSFKGFTTIEPDISSSKPYGLRPDILKDSTKYGLPKLMDNRSDISDIRVFTSKGIKYVPQDYPFPRKGSAFMNYKVFIPKAWGNWSEKNGLGGAYADIFIAKPGDACLETYLECGSFKDVKSANKLAKYLMTTFARALMYVNKHSQNNPKGAYLAIPKQDFHEEWWDLTIAEINEKLFGKYNIPQEIRDKVNKNIQTKDESNIIEL